MPQAKPPRSDVPSSFLGRVQQAVGMGSELAAAFPAARRVLAEVDDALDQPLSRLMAEGPQDELTLTETRSRR